MRWKRCLAFLMALSCLFLLYAQACPSRPIRVGYFLIEGYHELDAEGNRGGYGYEYLHEIAKTTGWTYEYVSGSWDECLTMLEKGEIDLMTAVQYNEERAAVFDFSSMPLGTSYIVLSVKEDNQTYLRDDYEGFDGMRIGQLRGNNNNVLLAEFAQEKGFTYQSQFYETDEQLREGLASGQVDAVLAGSIRKQTKERIIARFAPTPFYGAVTKGNIHLLEEMNHALEEIEMVNPAYKFNLHNAFYRGITDGNLVFSAEEQEYLDGNPVIRVVAMQAAPPLSYFDGGQYKGVTADLLELISTDLGLTLEYIETDNYEQALEYVRTGEADIISVVEADYNWGERNHIRITAPYMELSYSTITRKDAQAATDTIATVGGTLLQDKFIEKLFAGAEILTYSWPEQAVAAVAQRQADIAYIDTYTAEQLLGNRYAQLKASVAYGATQALCLGVSAQCVPELYSVLDKKVSDISTVQLSAILAKHTTFLASEMTLMDYAKQYPIRVITTGGLIFLLVLATFACWVYANKRNAAKMFDLAYRDPMTDLWNSSGFAHMGKLRLKKGNEPCVGVAMLDVNRFSRINDSFGREAGDLYIASLGRELQKIHGDQVLAGHINADRFVLLLQCGNRGEMVRTVKRICNQVEQLRIPDYTAAMVPTVGVYLMDFEEVDLSVAIDRAEAARAEGKRKNAQVVYYSEELREHLNKERLISERLMAAIAAGDIQVYYQPKYNMKTREIMGAEALARWSDSVMGFMRPAEFIPVLEKSGEIFELDFYMLARACNMVKRMEAQHLPPIPISVNQSRADFQKPDYMERLQATLHQYNVNPGCIELEITETMFENETLIEELVRRMKRLGVLISVDDFGTGYSSLHMLNRVAVDVLKVDRALLQDALNKTSVRKIIQKVVEMAQDLGLEVICEGVEQVEQAEMLMEIGCLYAQGMYYAHPMPEEEFFALLQLEDGKDQSPNAQQERLARQ